MLLDYIDFKFKTFTSIALQASLAESKRQKAFAARDFARSLLNDIALVAECDWAIIEKVYGLKEEEEEEGEEENDGRYERGTAADYDPNAVL